MNYPVRVLLHNLNLAFNKGLIQHYTYIPHASWYGREIEPTSATPISSVRAVKVTFNPNTPQQTKLKLIGYIHNQYNFTTHLTPSENELMIHLPDPTK